MVWMRGTCVAVVIAAVAAVLATGAGAAPRVRGVPVPSRQRGAYRALIVAAQRAWSKPGGGRAVASLPVQTDWSAQPLVLLVLGSSVRRGREWLRLRLPQRPNGAAGWILRNRVVLSHTRYWINVRLRPRLVDVYRSGRLVGSYPAVIGKASTPTPLGLFSIYEHNPQPSPNDFLGPWSLPLTAFSDTLLTFGGGPGRVAIHGRSDGSLADPLGSAASHGCIRIDNGPITWIADHVPAGAPVQITN